MFVQYLTRATQSDRLFNRSASDLSEIAQETRTRWYLAALTRTTELTVSPCLPGGLCMRLPAGARKLPV